MVVIVLGYVAEELMRANENAPWIDDFRNGEYNRFWSSKPNTPPTNPNNLRCQLMTPQLTALFFVNLENAIINAF